MERLTSWNEDCVQINGHALGYATKCELVQMTERLAAYEDTGLTPGEIKAPFTEGAVINLAAQTLGVESSRLRELAEADKAGRCVVLPCNTDCSENIRNAHSTKSGKTAISVRVVNSRVTVAK